MIDDRYESSSQVLQSAGTTLSYRYQPIACQEFATASISQGSLFGCIPGSPYFSLSFSHFLSHCFIVSKLVWPLSPGSPHFTWPQPPFLRSLIQDLIKHIRVFGTSMGGSIRRCILRVKRGSTSLCQVPCSCHRLLSCGGHVTTGECCI